MTHTPETLDEQIDAILDKFADYEEHGEYHYDCDIEDGHVEYDSEEAKKDLKALIEKERELAVAEERLKHSVEQWFISGDGSPQDTKQEGEG